VEHAVNRVRDYCGFAIRFVGLGYIVLWPVTAPASLMQSGPGRASAPLWHYLCHGPHVFSLPPGLHLIGMVCVACLAVRMIMRPLARRRQGEQRAVMPAARLSAAVPRQPRHKPLGPHRTVKPRSQFGLRGMPR
jgi:hypothetical protein